MAVWSGSCCTYRLCIWHSDNAEMSKCASVDEELNQEEKDHTLSQRGLDTLDSVVVGTKDQNGQDDVVRYFNNNVSQ